jgi:DNA-binding phage protein
MDNLMSQKANLTSLPKEQFSTYNVADHLTNCVEIAAYLKAAKEENDPSLLAAVIEDIQRIEARKNKGDTQ